MSCQVVQGIAVPAFLYGTAWKEDATLALTRAALKAGFRGIDTANQRRHYFEAAVGSAVQAAIAEGSVTRGELFLQSKFTHRAGQDHRLPYDPAADPGTQVAQSFQSSLEHFGTDYLDCYLLHGPSRRQGLSPDDWSVWRAMEELHVAQKVRLIGVSNVSLEQLALLHRQAAIKPSFVQNRCYASTGWDRDVRSFCDDHAISYQGFSLLTANRAVVEGKLVASLARRHGRTPAQIVFRFALEVGMLPLTGTSEPLHMRQDLECEGFELLPDEVRAVERALA